jgi:hypothetical protein
MRYKVKGVVPVLTEDIWALSVGLYTWKASRLSPIVALRRG